MISLPPEEGVLVCCKCNSSLNKDNLLNIRVTYNNVVYSRFACTVCAINCSICDKVIFKSGLCVNGNYVCRKCYSINFTNCNDCNKAILIKDIHNNLCIECYSIRYDKCIECQLIYKKEDLCLTLQKEYVCKNCSNLYVFCYDCSYITKKYSGYSTEYYNICSGRRRLTRGVFLCVNCISNYIRCKECDNLYSKNSDFCSYCSYYIDDYGYKPCPIFLHTDNIKNNNKQLFLGFELEVDFNKKIETNLKLNKVAKNVTSMSKILYCKEDGSLNNGFEIVSHPFSFEWWKEHKKDIFNVIKYVRQNNYNSLLTNTCGMHVHMSRSSFSSLDLYKILKLIYNNRSFMELFSQRAKHGGFRYSRFDLYNEVSKNTYHIEQYIDKNRNLKIAEVLKRITSSITRDMAINLKNDETVEIRMFKGTLSCNNFSRNIEFCFALLNFVRSVGVNDINIKYFKDFCLKNKKDFPNLFKFTNAIVKRIGV
jgi:hypothetical protein